MAAKKQTKKDESEEIKELLQRTQANFENYRKQTEKRVDEIREMASRDIILQLLPVLDNFNLALKNTGTGDGGCKNFVQGVELIYAQLSGLLEDNGIKEIETDGKEFDPYLHEALMKVDSEFPENTVVEEIQKGYLLNDKVIRHAKVKISNGKK